MNDNLHFLAANIACVEAEIQLDRVLYEAKTHMDNAKNFKEILNSLQKHSSSECAAYACELLGFDVMSQEATTVIKEQQAEKKQSFGARIRQAIDNWWNQFLRFLGWLKDKIGKFIRAIGRALHLVKDPAKSEIHVSFNSNELKVAAHNCEAGTNAPKPVKKTHTISVKDVPEYMNDLKGVTDAVVNKAKDIDQKKKTNPGSAEKDMLKMKQEWAQWAQAANKEIDQMIKDMKSMDDFTIDIKQMDKVNPGLCEELLKILGD